MVKRMSDDDVQEYVYNKMFGDLDRIESKSLFSDKDSAVAGIADNAKPESTETGGVKITIQPLMASAEEGGKPPLDEDEDRLKGIGGMSPMMERLHGKR